MPCDKPCPQCPFSRATPKSYLDTRGDNGHRFIGQSVGPFELPCHMTREFSDFKERFVNDEANPPCIGAQVYRANLGISHLFPPHMRGEGKTNYENVFGGHDELLAHHLGVSLEEAQEILRLNPPSYFLSLELAKSSVTTKPLKS